MISSIFYDKFFLSILNFILKNEGTLTAVIQVINTSNHDYAKSNKRECRKFSY